MKKLLISVVIVIVWAASSYASGALIYGRVAYEGSVCEDCTSKPKTTNLFGYVRWMDIVPFLDLSLGFDYVHSSTEGCNNVDFTNYAIHASANVTLLSIGIVKSYLGGGLSYNYFRYGGGSCKQSFGRSEIGYHGLIGLRSALPASPLNAFIEGRISKVGNEPKLTMKSLRFGVEISLGG